MRNNPWLFSLTVTALAVAVSLWLWFGPWLWAGIPWLVAAGLPFLIGLFVPRIPLLFGVVVAVLPYLVEGDVQAGGVLRSIGAAWIAAGVGILIRRMALMQGGKTE